jgi:alpha-beta hydrolase superfamily lysophospholipase
MDAALAWLRPWVICAALPLAGGAVGAARAEEELPPPPPPPLEEPRPRPEEPPTPPEPPPGPPPQRLVLLLHGYTSGSGELAGLAELLRGPGPQGAAPLHVHSLDFGSFTRVSHDHNLAVDTLAELLLAAVAALPDRCRVCHAQAEAEVPVAIVARSFGGIIAREAMLRGLATRRAPWHIDRFVTMGTPWMGT